MTKEIENQTYANLLQSLKTEISKARIKAHLSVNKEMINLYWSIGNQILERQKDQGWGSKVIENISKDLRSEFPEMKGLSARNLKYMRKFAEEHSDRTIVLQLVAQIPWGHICVIMDKLKEHNERIWYVQKTIEYGWSRNVLGIQIQSNLYAREGKSINNFNSTLPAPQSDLASSIIKDPYKFDFLFLGKEAHEREIEKELIKHIEKLLLELGSGFAFVGKQYPLSIGGDDYFVDMLFYHLKLRCYVVVELKAGKFKPEYTGKLNFYLSAVDDILRHKDDKPSIGLLLCKDKGDQIKAEYSLRDMTKPIGLAEYRLIEQLPDEIKTSLPSIEELEKELSKIE